MTSFSITKLTSQYDVTKKFVKEPDEKGKHKRNATPFSRGKAETVVFKDMYEFKEFMQKIGTKELIMMGIGDSPKSFVAPKNKLDQFPGTIARSKENFPFSTEDGILFVDYDPSEDDRPLSKELLLAQIFDIFPELQNAPMLWKPSSGSCIWNKDKKEWYVGVSGQHMFFHIDNQSKSKAIIYHLHERINAIDVQTPQGNRLSYQGCTCEDPFEKRDEEFEVRNADQKPADTSRYSDGTIESEKKAKYSALGKQSWEERYEDIANGNSYHENIRNLAWGMARDGMEQSMIASTIRMSMRQVDETQRDDRWKTRYDDIERQVKTAVDYYSASTETITEHEGVYIPDHTQVKFKKAPLFPFGVMSGWPEPWNLIWENWARFPRRLNEPLLIPTILSAHAYMLDGGYRNRNGRRPNMYWLTLAESTAHKDTNSTDVLRDIGTDMRMKGIMNSAFDRMHTSDSSLTSDTAFIKSVEAGDGSLYWNNTEATRVFQQLANSSNNSSVMALSDKMIEVVDGHEIRGKRKAEHSVNTIMNPNVQIVFYAQPETITKYMTTDMIDSGFLGRAVITLDAQLAEEEMSLFDDPDYKGGWKEMSKELSDFYAKLSTIKNSLDEIHTASIGGANLSYAKKFEQEVMLPMLKNDDSETGKQLQKMIKRMAVSIEQIYCIVLGICREWDIHCGKEPRVEISMEKLFPLFEYWTKCKHYAVTEFISERGDVISHAIEESMRELISGRDETGIKITIPSRYAKHKKQISAGLVPMYMVVDRIRRRQSVLRSLHGAGSQDVTNSINRTISSLIQVGLIGMKEIRTSQMVNRKTKYLFFYK